MNMRPSWDEYFLNLTNLAAKRSTCLRRQVGCLLVKNRRILATGYNGAPSGITHCEVAGCLRKRLNVPAGERHELCRGLHAEQNALLQAANYGIMVRGSILYSTIQPCIICTKMLINAGVREVVCLEEYPDKMAKDMLDEAGIKIRSIKKKPLTNNQKPVTK